jgi:hypothetical protein
MGNSAPIDVGVAPDRYRVARRDLEAIISSRRSLSADALAARGHVAAKEAGDGQIFINLWPMDSVTVAEPLEIVPLGFGGVQKARIPGERNGNGASIGELTGKFIVREGERDTPHFFIVQSSHSRVPSISCARRAKAIG